MYFSRALFFVSAYQYSSVVVTKVDCDGTVTELEFRQNRHTDLDRDRHGVSLFSTRQVFLYERERLFGEIT